MKNGRVRGLAIAMWRMDVGNPEEAESSEAVMKLSKQETMVPQTGWWPWSGEQPGIALIQALAND